MELRKSFLINAIIILWILIVFIAFHYYKITELLAYRGII